MELTKDRRFVESNEVTLTSAAAFRYGLKELAKPNLTYRLGLLWIILDPFIIAMVYTFLIVVVRGNYSGFSIFIGVVTLKAMNRGISRNMPLDLAKEPFPMMHTPTKSLLISRYSTSFFESAIVGLASSCVIIPISGSPFSLAIHMPIICILIAGFGTTLGLIISPLSTMIADVKKIISYLLLASLFLLAVLYDYNATTGIHRTVLSLIPHTFGVEWLRHVVTGQKYPFSPDYVILVSSIWCLFFLIGILRIGKSRWRLTSWG